jgi:RHS repeat-associated protein
LSTRRITSVADVGSSPSSWSYDYDALDRLTSALSPTLTQGWSYDANGNRLSESGTQASTFTVSATSNRLNATAGFLNRSYSYDAAGNALAYEDVTLSYNNRNRLASTTKGASTRSYVYNALGQMAKATGGAGGTVHYLHDEAGHLLGEYDSAGNLIQETVWLGDLPVATIRPDAAGTGIDVFYVHADQLGTPRIVTDAANNLRWRWPNDPFGTLAAEENPASLGVFTYNLRFPGQLFDGQAGLHQNYFRDYSPAIGRYTQSDPIGMGGGINPYAYVLNNPALLTDPQGEAIAIPVGPAVAAIGIVVICSTTQICSNAAKAVVNAAEAVADAMTAPGKVADTQIVRDYEAYASAERACGKTPKDRCQWLEENKSKYRADQVRATQKAWGCRRSRAGR